MSFSLRVLFTLIGWTAGVTLLHLGLNTRVLDYSAAPTPAENEFRVGFLPVT
jgi:hypothetical protein